MEEKPNMTLVDRILRWTAGVGAAAMILPSGWAFANYAAHNRSEQLTQSALVCSDVDGPFSHTVVQQEWLRTDVGRTRNYFFVESQSVYTDRDGDDFVDSAVHRTTTVFGGHRVRSYERESDFDMHRSVFVDADIEYMHQLDRFMLR